MKSVIPFLLLLCSSAYAEQPARWDGFFIGLEAGGVWNDSDWTYDNANWYNTAGPVLLGSDFESSTSGVAGGAFLGFNHQAGPLILGVEGSVLDADLFTAFYSPFYPTEDKYNIKTSYFVMAKARIGYPFYQWLIYINGGWAGGPADLTLKDTVHDIKASSSPWVNGWTVGAGLSYKLSQYFSAGLAYDFIQLNMNNESISCDACGTGVGFGTPIVSGDISTQAWTIRMSYFFN